MIKGTACTVTYTAWDETTGDLKTSDVYNHTVTISKDGGTPATATNSPVEVGNGVYKITLTSTETNCDLLTLIVVSATTGVVIPPVQFVFHDVTLYKADVSGLATSSALSTVSGNVSSINTAVGNLATSSALSSVAGTVSSINTAVGNLATSSALSSVAGTVSSINTAVGNLATSSALSTLSSTVDAVKAKTDTITAPPSATSIAQAVLGQSVEAVEATAAALSLGTVILATLNSEIEGEEWVIKKSDGTTHTTRAVTTTRNAAPITGIGDVEAGES